MAVHRVGSDFWLLEARDTVDPRAVIKDPTGLHPALDQERANGGPRYRFYQVPEADAVQYIVADGFLPPDDIALPLPAASEPPATASLTASPAAEADGLAQTGTSDGPTEGTKPATAGPSGDDQAVLNNARDTNALVKRELERNPEATSVAISKATGIPDQTVRQSKAWKERPRGQVRQASKTADAMDHHKPLTTSMLAVIDSRAAAPDDIIANQEEPDDPEAIDPAVARRRRFLETATPGDRGRLLSLPMQEQERELEAWDLSGKFMPDEPPMPGALKAKMRR